MVGWVVIIILFILVVSACCSSDNNSSSNTTTNRNARSEKISTNRYSYSSYSYSECPSCGAPYFDGYCEECGYPDINQGWIGENY